MTDAADQPIATLAGLQELCRELEAAKILAIDTEFIREQSYLPRLELVQVATPSGRVAAIDYGSLLKCWPPGAIDPFRKLLLSPAILKVFHAADQDLEILSGLCGGEMPAPFFDTQIAAGFVGLGASLGYGALVDALLGVRLQKGEKMTDWSRRPLSPEQIAYALDDVRYLLPVHSALVQELNRLERVDWVEKECEALSLNIRANLASRESPPLAYLRVKGRGMLDARGLCVLRELARWREEEARRQDRPRGSVMKDELLVELARRSPRTQAQIGGLRGFHVRDLDRYGSALVAVVQEALGTPKETWPRPEPRGPASDQGLLALADLLHAVTHLVATESKVAVSLLAGRADLQRLAAGERDLDILQGWRGSLLGQRLLAMVEGTCSLSWDPQAQTLLLTPKSQGTIGSKK